MTKVHDEMPKVYDLVIDGIGEPIRKFPCKSPLGTLTILRFTAPNRANPHGTVVAKGHPPFSPRVIGMALVERT